MTKPDTDMSERRFPILKGHGKTIPWGLAEKAYPEYCNRGGSGQSLERVAERGGFCEDEMDIFYPAWREESKGL